MSRVIVSTFILLALVVIDAQVVNELNLKSLFTRFSRQFQESNSDPNDPLGMKGTLKLRCTQVSGSDQHFQRANEASGKLEQCLYKYVNVTEEDYKDIYEGKEGAADKFFAKYCKKLQPSMVCFEDFQSALDPCLYSKHKENLMNLRKLAKTFVNYACDNEGEKLAAFIKNKGAECLQEKFKGIDNCLAVLRNQLYLKSIYDLPIINFNEFQCSAFDGFRDCSHIEVKNCTAPVPAMILYEAYSFIKLETPCYRQFHSHDDKPPRNKKEKLNFEKPKSGAGSNFLASTLVVLVTLLFLSPLYL